MADQRLYQIALTKVLGVGSKRGKLLVAYCGGVESVFHEKKSSLLKIPGIDGVVAQAISDANPALLAKTDLEYIDRHKVKTTFFLDEDYPTRLTHVDDGPLLLYSKGEFRPNPPKTVAIVGTRKPSAYGKEICEQLIVDLQAYNIQLISGLAYGIDACSHKKACSLQMENLAIMGTGIDQLYPAAHRSLAREIESCGSLITEYPLNARADRENFPRRNRVIAAMADVIIVVQSASKGGSLITAEFGNQYFKDVFAFPGRINDAEFAGCNALIKQHKAHLLMSVADIAYIMRWEEKEESKDIQPQLFVELTSDEDVVFNHLKSQESASIDWIHSQAKMNMGQLSSILLSLEFKGLIRTLPGKRYQKI